MNVLDPTTPLETDSFSELLHGIIRPCCCSEQPIKGWKPGSFCRQSLNEQLEPGEMYLGKIGGEIVGTITLQWSDRLFWGEIPQEAGYIHKLAVKRAYAGRGIGLELPRWAEKQASTAGKRYLRQNCLASDRSLCDYYEKAGFNHIRNVLEARGLGRLYEKRL